MTVDDGETTDWEATGGEDPEADPGEELEAAIEQADGYVASESFGTTAEEEEEGEPLDLKLAEERSSKPPIDRQLAIEDFDVPDDEDELVAMATVEQDPFVAPEEAAMTVRERAPGAVDHPPDEAVEPVEDPDEED
jgi:hypothetical protein